MIDSFPVTGQSASIPGSNGVSNIVGVESPLNLPPVNWDSVIALGAGLVLGGALIFAGVRDPSVKLPQRGMMLATGIGLAGGGIYYATVIRPIFGPSDPDEGGPINPENPPTFESVLTFTPAVLTAQITDATTVLSSGGPGIKLPIDNAVYVQVLVDLSVTNPSNQVRYIGNKLDLRRRNLAAPDTSWVSIDPVSSTPTEFFDIQPLNPSVTAGFTRIDPGVTIPLIRSGITLEGPAFGVIERAVWVTQSLGGFVDIDFNLDFEFWETTAPQTDVGRRKAITHWGPAFTADVPILGL